MGWGLCCAPKLMRTLAFSLILFAVGCGPAARQKCTGTSCDTGATCNPGDTQACYTGSDGTKDVGPCHGGMQTCTSAGQWGDCAGEVTPSAEICGDNIDNDCNGKVDDDVDNDGDGWTTCQGDCCDSTAVCSNPAGVNPGAYDTPGDGVDNDCDGTPDNAQTFCDQGIASNTQDAMDFAKAIDLCQTATENTGMPSDKKWGVIDAKLTWPDGTHTPDPNEYSVRPKFGTNVMPQGGFSMAVISSGAAAAKGDTNPAYHDFVSYESTNESPFPADFVMANGGKLPNAPGCPDPNGTTANDPVMLTLRVRVPTNAQSFSLKVNFYSAEFPEWTCSPYNDFFVVLLDSQYSGANPNPTDKNLAFYTPPGSTTMRVPVGVNLAHGDTGLFTQCVNGSTGCSGTPGTITTCTGTQDLIGTGFDDPEQGSCDSNSLKGGATGWLTTTGNVKPGEIMTLRIAIWDTSDHAYDSLALVDGFQWSAEPSTPGTIIGRYDEQPMSIPGTAPVSAR